MINKTIILLMIALKCGIAQDLDQITFESIFSEQEKAAMGAEKLSEAEKAKVRDYMIEFYLRGNEKGKAEASTVAVQPRTYAPAPPSPEVIESKVDGDFDGWDGETIIKLFNGQIWQQTEYYYHYNYSFMPSVVIYKSGTGYKMKVDGIDKAIGVKRIK